MGFSAVELRLDSMVVANCLNGDSVSEGCASDFCLLGRIRELMRSAWRVNVTHVYVYREANKWVVFLANMGCDLDGTMLMLDRSPHLLAQFLLCDVMRVHTHDLLLFTWDVTL